MTARVAEVPRPGQECVVVSWGLATDGRKRHTASALFGSGGRLLGVARALWIELRR